VRSRASRWWLAAAASAVVAAGACSLVVDVDRPLRLPDGAPLVCSDDADCDDGLECTELVCQEETCVMAAGGDTRDRDGDGHAGAACAGPDCDDADAEVNPDAAERCNDRDDDCDGVADDGAWGTVTLSDLLVPGCDKPDLAASAASAGFVCESVGPLCEPLGDDVSRCLVFGTLSSTGDLVTPAPIAPILMSAPTEPAVAAAEPLGGYGVVWADRRHVWFAFVPTLGTFEPGTETQVTGGEPVDRSAPDIAWTGARFAVAWSEADPGGGLLQIRTVEISYAAGTATVEGAPMVATVAAGAAEPSVASVSGGVVLAWTESTAEGGTGVRLAHVDSTGTVTPHEPVFDAGGGRSPDLAGRGPRELGLVYRDVPADQRAGEVYYVGVGWAGGAITVGSPIRLSTATGESDAPSLAVLADGRAAVAWHDERSGDRQVMLARLGPDAAVIATDLVVSPEGVRADRPILVASSSDDLLEAYRTADGASTALLGCLDGP
jgi:hypothetical protein